MIRGWQISAIVAGAAIVGLAGMTSSASARVLVGEAFLCHGVRAARAPRGLPPLPGFHPRVALPVVDRFSRPIPDDPHTLDLRRTAMLCRPVSIEDGEASDRSYDFAGYEARRTRRSPMPPAPPPVVEDVDGPFGGLRLRIAGVAALAVPTLAADGGIPSGLPPDHFACYAARAVRTPGERPAVRHLIARVGSGEQRLEVRKPRRLCVPASVRGGDPTAPKHAVDLLCYEARAARDVDARQTAPRGSELIATRNDFGSEVVRLGAAQLLCIAVER